MAMLIPAGAFDLGQDLKDHGTVLTFLFAVCLCFSFLFGYALRDVLQRRGQRRLSTKARGREPRRE